MSKFKMAKIHTNINHLSPLSCPSVHELTRATSSAPLHFSPHIHTPVFIRVLIGPIATKTFLLLLLLHLCSLLSALSFQSSLLLLYLMLCIQCGKKVRSHSGNLNFQTIDDSNSTDIRFILLQSVCALLKTADFIP